MLASAVPSCREYDQSRSAVRQHRATECVEHDHLKFKSVSHRPHNDDEAPSVSPKQSSGTISERAKSALERRLRPHTTLSCYELADSLRISESTLWAILSGNSKSGPSGRVLQKLVEFFGASFPHEVFSGPNIHVIDPRSNTKAARIAELHEELRRLG